MSSYESRFHNNINNNNNNDNHGIVSSVVWNEFSTRRVISRARRRRLRPTDARRQRACVALQPPAVGLPP